MTDDERRWKFLLAGHVEVSIVYNKLTASPLGLQVEVGDDVAFCRTPYEVNQFIDHCINLRHFNGSIH
jgi:hypothetical protein